MSRSVATRPATGNDASPQVRSDDQAVSTQRREDAKARKEDEDLRGEAEDPRRRGEESGSKKVAGTYGAVANIDDDNQEWHRDFTSIEEAKQRLEELYS